jgi:hypothetical protein
VLDLLLRALPTGGMPDASPSPNGAAKFVDPVFTATGERRASVPLRRLDTLWFNTGTLCNVTCRHCYIESSPRNDRLAYLTRRDVTAYLDEVEGGGLGTSLIGFTGGEPCMNPDLVPMLEDVLGRGLHALVLTNAMQPLRRIQSKLLDLRARHGRRLGIRVSLDHYAAAVHDAERGPGSWARTLEGLVWLARHDFAPDVAGRHFTAETEETLRTGYAGLFARLGIEIEASDPVRLMLFPEMDTTREVPEITEACWGILHKSPEDVMCASARMVVRRNGAPHPAVLACTLLPYDERFELGTTLAEARQAVSLNHPYCASFCVLGGGACSR